MLKLFKQMYGVLQFIRHCINVVKRGITFWYTRYVVVQRVQLCQI